MFYWVVLFLNFITALSGKKYFTTLTLFILFFMAAFISPSVSHDFQNYYNGYYISNHPYFPEPLSRLAFRGVREVGEGISFSFFILGVISLYLKVKALNKLQLPIAIFFLLYFSKLFLLLDLTQVRAGVAVAICLLAFHAYIKNNYRLTLLYIAFAFCFHMSSIMFLAIFLLNTKRPNAIFWGGGLLSGIFISFLNLKGYLLSLMLFLHAPANYLTYLNNNSDFKVNPLNALTLINVGIFLLLCIPRDIFTGGVMNLAFKLYGVSVISFYVFIDFPVLSFRISEFFLVYQVVILSGLLAFIKLSQRRLYVTLLFIYSAAQLYFTYNKAAIIEQYASTLFG
ncbi:EpsG family protein [Mixta calida]|uniref:EpsG family protein n=1 Tax=Mixta calida TaxID=665913 RepID=UPI0034D6727B